MMRRRRAEDERALAVAGVSPVHLDFLDRQYTDDERDVEAIAAAIRLVESRWSALFAPAAVGGYTRLVAAHGLTLAPHPDHEVVRDAAVALSRPGIPTYFYAEIPYASGDARGLTWPKGLTDFTPVLEASVGASLQAALNEHSDESLARRLEAISQYTTQIARLEEGVGRFANDPSILRYEVLWTHREGHTRQGIRRRMRPR
jgi:LmbE family N-acetylglucosaminyl deacetylase